jgi:hypothetical protein
MNCGKNGGTEERSCEVALMRRSYEVGEEYKDNKTVPILSLCLMDSINKTIYTTYHSRLPPIVLKRWKDLNPEYAIDFSMDIDCIKFLDTEFHRHIAQLFIYINRGMYKADLWRLCKLYVHGGVYADIDLIPFVPISKSITDDSCRSEGPGYFYSCLSLSSPSIFQAFMYHSKRRSPLLLGFLVSFLVNKPYTNIDNGPTSDMYHLILYNVRAEAAEAESVGGTKVIPEALQPFTYYYLRKIRIPIYITSLDEDIIQLHYFPSDVEYVLSINSNTRNKWVLANQDKLKMKIENHCLILNTPEVAANDNDNADTSEGYIVDICMKLPELQPEVIYLFQECIRDPCRITTCYIADCNGTNIMDCRDPNYVRDRGWVNQ